MNPLVSAADVDAAAARIEPFIVHTPVLTFSALDTWARTTLFVKAEHRQHTGAFKYRGATNAVQSLTAREAARGVAAHSSGNHAAALARAAQVRGIRAYVVMPEATSPFKRAAVERFGADITICANSYEARRDALRAVTERSGAVEIHPFENPNVIAGAATAARELLAEVPDLDAIVAPVGGGGLCSGTSVAAGGMRVIGAHPLDNDATLADGLRTGTSPITDALLNANHVERTPIDDDAIVAAQATVRELTGEIIEPSAAIAFAAAHVVDLDGARVGVICSGGNVAPA